MMKRIVQYMILLTVSISGALYLQSCGDDDEKTAPMVLVVAERNTGKVFTVNNTTGAKTEVGEVMFNSAPLTNIRGMIYSSADEKVFASTTDNGGGKFYSIDTEGVATLLDGNVDGEWYGVADLLMTSDNKVLAILWFKSNSVVGEGPGLQTWGATGTPSNQHLFTDDNVCCGLGMVYGTSNNQLLIASYGLEIYTSDLNGNNELLTSLTPEGFDEGDVFDLYIQNMVKDSRGTIYAIVYDDVKENTYLAEVNITDETISMIGQINSGDNNRYHGLMFMPGDLL